MIGGIQQRILFTIGIGTAIYTWVLNEAGLISFRESFDIPNREAWSYVINIDIGFAEIGFDLFDLVPDFLTEGINYVIYVVTLPLSFIDAWITVYNQVDLFGLEFLILIPPILLAIVGLSIAWKVLWTIIRNVLPT